MCLYHSYWVICAQYSGYTAAVAGRVTSQDIFTKAISFVATISNRRQTLFIPSSIYNNNFFSYCYFQFNDFEYSGYTVVDAGRVTSQNMFIRVISFVAINYNNKKYNDII